MAWPNAGLFCKQDARPLAGSSASPPKRTESAVVGAVSVGLMAGLLSLVAVVRRIRDAAQGKARRADAAGVEQLGVEPVVLRPSPPDVFPHPAPGALPGPLETVRPQPQPRETG